MKLMFACLALTAFATTSMAAMKTQTIEYKAGDVTMKGFLAYDDAKASPDMKAPGVIVFPEWWGLDNYPKHRAEQLAALGYVAFAADMYGDEKTTNDPAEAGKWATEVKSNPELEKTRFEAALNTFKQQTMLDTTRIGAIGYCFGGSMVLDMARTNQPLVGIVSFHGDLSTKMAKPDEIKMKILVCNGAADAFVPPAAVDAFKAEMKDAKADAKVIDYADAHHAFTNPEADSHHLENIKYNEKADHESWDAMKKFFADIFRKSEKM